MSGGKKKLILFLGSVVVISTFLILSSSDQPIPKPSAFLRIDLPKPLYERIELPHVSFKKNRISYYDTSSQRLIYPDQNASIHLTYSSIKKRKLRNLVADVEKLTFNHTIKADKIESNIYLNTPKRTFGRCYDVLGDAASPVQFYVTDSLTHFLNGALYFNMVPDYDYIYPIVYYIRQDINVLLKSIEWK